MFAITTLAQYAAYFTVFYQENPHLVALLKLLDDEAVRVMNDWMWIQSHKNEDDWEGYVQAIKHCMVNSDSTKIADPKWRDAVDKIAAMRIVPPAYTPEFKERLMEVSVQALESLPESHWEKRVQVTEKLMEERGEEIEAWLEEMILKHGEFLQQTLVMLG